MGKSQLARIGHAGRSRADSSTLARNPAGGSGIHRSQMRQRADAETFNNEYGSGYLSTHTPILLLDPG